MWAPWWHWAGMVGVWLVVIGAALWATNRLFPADRLAGTPDPRETLDGRLARGELDVDHYRRLRDELEGV